LEVARRCFLEHGPNVSTAAIAAELGVSPPALFRRVKTKEELLRRALQLPVYPPWIEHIERGPDGRPIAEQLLALATEIDDFFSKMAPALATLRASGVRVEDMFAQFEEPPPIRAVRVLGRWFEAAAAREVDIDFGALAIAFLGTMQARHMSRHLLGKAFPDGGPRYLETVVSVFARALTEGSSP
jgi:AcrR family transcriptional regulator